MRYLVVLLLAGCASASGSGPFDVGQGAHMITGQNRALGATSNNVVRELHHRATAFCAGRDQAMEVVSIDTHGAGLGRFPEGRMQFRCVAK